MHQQAQKLGLARAEFLVLPNHLIANIVRGGGKIAVLFAEQKLQHLGLGHIGNRLKSFG